MPPGGFPHFSPFGLIRRPQRHDHALAAFGQDAHVVGPHRQRGLHLALVAAAIVNACGAALVAALVVQNLFDDVRLHAEISHAARGRPANVVQHERRDAVAERLVERGLAIAPRLEALRADAEQIIAAGDMRHGCR